MLRCALFVVQCIHSTWTIRDPPDSSSTQAVAVSHFSLHLLNATPDIPIKFANVKFSNADDSKRGNALSLLNTTSGSSQNSTPAEDILLAKGLHFTADQLRKTMRGENHSSSDRDKEILVRFRATNCVGRWFDDSNKEKAYMLIKPAPPQVPDAEQDCKDDKFISRQVPYWSPAKGFPGKSWAQDDSPVPATICGDLKLHHWTNTVEYDMAILNPKATFEGGVTFEASSNRSKRQACENVPDFSHCPITKDMVIIIGDHADSEPVAWPKDLFMKKYVDCAKPEQKQAILSKLSPKSSCGTPAIANIIVLATIFLLI